MRYGVRSILALLLAGLLVSAAGCGDAPPEKARPPLVRTERVETNEAAHAVNSVSYTHLTLPTKLEV